MFESRCESYLIKKDWVLFKNVFMKNGQEKIFPIFDFNQNRIMDID